MSTTTDVAIDNVASDAIITIDNDNNEDTYSVNSFSSGRESTPSVPTDHLNYGVNGNDSTDAGSRDSYNENNINSNQSNITNTNNNGTTTSSLAKGVAAHNSKLLPVEYKLGDDDVICGRGSRCFNHTGNKKFRNIVEEHLDRYSNTTCKFDKTNIICEIVNIVRQNSPNGGFVKKDSSTGRYYEVGDFLAREKTSQAFRDALQDQYKSSNATKKKRRLLESQLHLHKSVSAPFLSNRSPSGNGTVMSTPNPAAPFLRNNDYLTGTSSMHRQVTDTSLVSSQSSNMMTNSTAAGGSNLNIGRFQNNPGAALSAQRNATFSNFQSQMHTPDNIRSSGLANASFAQQQQQQQQHSAMQNNSNNTNGDGNTNIFLQQMRMNQMNNINGSSFPGASMTTNSNPIQRILNGGQNNTTSFQNNQLQNQTPRFASVLGNSNSFLQQFNVSNNSNNITNSSLPNALQDQPGQMQMDDDRINKLSNFSNNINVINNTSDTSMAFQQQQQQQQLQYQNHQQQPLNASLNMNSNHNMMAESTTSNGNDNFAMMSIPGTNSNGPTFYNNQLEDHNPTISRTNGNIQQHDFFSTVSNNDVDMEAKLDQLDKLLTESIQNEEDCTSSGNDRTNNYLNLMSNFFDNDLRGGNFGRSGSVPQSCPDLRGNIRNSKRVHTSISQMRNEAFVFDNVQSSIQGRQLSSLLEDNDESTSSVTGGESKHTAGTGYSKMMNWEGNEQRNGTATSSLDGGASQQNQYENQNQLSSEQMVANFEPLPTFYSNDNDCDLWGGQQLGQLGSVVDSFDDGRNLNGRSGQLPPSLLSASLAGAQSCPDLGNQPKVYRPSKLGAARIGRQMLSAAPYESNQVWGSRQNSNTDPSRSGGTNSNAFACGKANDLLARLGSSSRSASTNANQQQQASGNSFSGLNKRTSACGKPNDLMASIGMGRAQPQDGLSHQKLVDPGESYGFGQANNNPELSFRHGRLSSPSLGSNQLKFQKQQDSNSTGGCNDVDQLPYIGEDDLMRLPTLSESEFSCLPDDDGINLLTDDIFLT